jgi:hypothetical protein
VMCRFRAAIYLNHLTQGVALGYGIFWLSARGKPSPNTRSA